MAVSLEVRATRHLSERWANCDPSLDLQVYLLLFLLNARAAQQGGTGGGKSKVQERGKKSAKDKKDKNKTERGKKEKSGRK